MPPTDSTLDFALLQQSATRPVTRNRVALLWLLGLLALLVGSVVALLLYLNRFEQEEAQRRRASDAQWLEQSVQFHFRRLEDDLLVLARQTVQRADAASAVQAETVLHGGLLWREPGVLLSQGWIAAELKPSPADVLPRWHADRVPPTPTTGRRWT